MNDEFMSYGGSELGCMSTSESLKIIANYAYSSSPLLFRIKVETPMDRGARLKWLSVYPDEDEGARRASRACMSCTRTPPRITRLHLPLSRGSLSAPPPDLATAVLYPPLTYLKPMLKQKIKGMGGEVVTLKAVFPS